LIVERIGVISRELERDLFLRWIFQFRPFSRISARGRRCARTGANDGCALVVPDPFQQPLPSLVVQFAGAFRRQNTLWFGGSGFSAHFWSSRNLPSAHPTAMKTRGLYPRKFSCPRRRKIFRNTPDALRDLDRFHPEVSAPLCC